MTRIFLDRRDATEDLRRLLDWLESENPAGGAGAECSPPLDILETPADVEIVVDLPGIVPEAIRVVFSRGMVVISGRKHPPPCDHAGAAFHLAERSFGRFVRIVELSGAFDLGRAAATLVAGELRVVLPRIEERRGRDIPIRVEA